MTDNFGSELEEVNELDEKYLYLIADLIDNRVMVKLMTAESEEESMARIENHYFCGRSSMAEYIGLPVFTMDLEVYQILTGNAK